METMESDSYNYRLTVFFDKLTSRYKVSSKIYNANLNRFFADLFLVNNAFLQYKSESDRFLSSDFCLFNYLNTDENSLSSYIAMLLDSNGEHGQQSLFLYEFIDFIAAEGLKEINRKDYQVYREYWADGRIDIFLHSEDTSVIIENKPYATDQPRQLSRYASYIGSDPECQKLFLVYLSPGNDPSSDSIPLPQLSNLKQQGKFLTISLYRFGEVFLKSCEKNCESQKFRFFIEDFRSFLMSTFQPVEENSNGGDQ